MWKYSTVDLCEIARNSVLQSGFEDCVKAYFLGDNFKLPGNYGNSIARTNVPGIRIEFRSGATPRSTIGAKFWRMLIAFTLNSEP